MSKKEKKKRSSSTLSKSLQLPAPAASNSQVSPRYKVNKYLGVPVETEKDIDQLLLEEEERLNELENQLARSHEITQNMVGVLNRYHSRLESLEKEILPLYTTTKQSRTIFFSKSLILEQSNFYVFHILFLRFFFLFFFAFIFSEIFNFLLVKRS